jgi:hypothetical protein
MENMRIWGKFLEQLYEKTGGADYTSADLYMLIKAGSYDLPDSIAQAINYYPNIAATKSAIYRIKNKRFEISNDNDHYLTLRWKKCQNKNHKHCGRFVFYTEKVPVRATNSAEF